MAPMLATTVVTDIPRYLELELVLDSGAGAHVASKKHCPGYAVQPSAMRQSGVGFSAADGGDMENYGEAVLNIMTLDKAGKVTAGKTTFNISDVTRALWSVGLMCDGGLGVTFKKEFASVMDPSC